MTSHGLQLFWLFSDKQIVKIKTLAGGGQDSDTLTLYVFFSEESIYEKAMLLFPTAKSAEYAFCFM